MSEEKSTRGAAPMPPVSASFEGEAERFDPSRDGPDLAYEHIHRYVLAGEVVAGLRVLDLAAGTGYGSSILARSAAQLVSLDLARAPAGRSESWVCADAQRLPFADRSFDAVVCFEAIEHVQDPAKLVSEARRVLRDPSILLISTPDREIYSARAGHENPFHISEMSRPEFQKLLRGHFSHVRMLGQGIWAGSWVAGLAPGQAARSLGKRSLQAFALPTELSQSKVRGQDVRWADREREELPTPVYLLAACSDTKEGRLRMARSLPAESILHDSGQWLLGQYDRLSQAWESELQSFQAELGAARRGHEDQSGQIQTARDSISRLEAEIVQARRSIALLEAEIAEARRVGEMRDRELSAAREIAQTRVPTSALEREVEAARAANEDLVRQVSTARVAMQDLESQLAVARDAIGDLENQVGGARSKIDDLTGELGVARAAAEDQSLRLEAARRAVDEKEGEIAAARATIDGKDRELAVARESVDRKDRELAVAKESVDSKERELAVAKESVDGKERELEVARSAFDRKQSELATARSVIDEKDREIERARVASDEADRLLEAAREESQDLRGRFEEARALADARRREVLLERTKLETARERAEQASRRIAELRSLLGQESERRSALEKSSARFIARVGIGISDWVDRVMGRG